MSIAPDGSFKFHESAFRNDIKKGSKFEPEEDRYHLYVSYACPWATRTLIVRNLKGLEKIIPVSIVSPRMDELGWPFANVDNCAGAEKDPLYDSKHIRDLYFRAEPNYALTKFSVPVLWDNKNHTIVNNESSEIIRIFNSAFNEFLPEDKKSLDLYPADLKDQIDEVNEWVFKAINVGVYMAGAAKAQEPYNKAVKALFEALDKVEKILDGKDYLVGDRLTEADVRLWVTTVRFDVIYVGLYKCNIRDIRHGYPNIDKWQRKLYWNNTAFKDSTDWEHIKLGYYFSPMSNPGVARIVPVGPLPPILPL